jgi:hypothetical protein
VSFTSFGLQITLSVWRPLFLFEGQIKGNPWLWVLTLMNSSDSQKSANKKNTLLEQHYSPAQVARMWGWSDDFVRNQFKNEPGVLVSKRPETMHKRSFSSMRIPESVLVRVGTRLQNK